MTRFQNETETGSKLMNSTFYAHSTNTPDKSNWQTLEDHLNGVAKRAAEFAKPFGGHDWGKIAGEHHDDGKGTNCWQAYLRHVNGIVDEFVKYYEGHPPHALVGAQYLLQHSQQAGKLLAYCIAGHHGGLPDWNGSTSSLGSKMAEPFVENSLALSKPKFPEKLPLTIVPERMGYQIQFFTRMLFSCLVDADFLDTEFFLERKKSGWRKGYPKIPDLQKRFWSQFNKLRKKADKNSQVNRQREHILENCLEASKKTPGLFSLTVPTGGGKTLSSLAFALNHAIQHNKRRIIYVIPFTSIIEQNAKVFREMLGDNAVLEHHCNYIVEDSDRRSRLSIENWDAPIVVTTNVQFFNSFYAYKTSKCRKLHNVTDSVIIFDEVQAIPVEKLKPCIEVIKELSENYGVTSVLCTATQPVLEYSEHFKSGLQNIREITDNVPELFTSLRRTKEVFIGTRCEQEIADELFEKKQVLCIVNTRQQALDIYNALPKSNANYHLSALMHPTHRTLILDEIRKKLSSDKKQECRVISTQLIEAGVDVDFPSVYRSVAGIDSIAQAAGRCNRNGKSDIPCEVCIFDFPKETENSYFRQAAQSAMKLFDSYSGRLTEPECVRKYFDDFYWKNEQRMDEQDILGKCMQAQTLEIQFREIADFQMIKSATIPVIVAVEDQVKDLVEKLNIVENPGGILRNLQQYTVQVYPYHLDEISNWLEEPLPGIWVLRSSELYSEITGLSCKEPEGNAFFG